MGEAETSVIKLSVEERITKHFTTSYGITNEINAELMELCLKFENTVSHLPFSKF